MNEDLKREKHLSTSQQVNIWKWAFITLSVLILSLVFFLIRILQPIEVSESNRNPSVISQDTIELSTSLNKNDTEKLLNTYLTYSIGEEFENYHIELSDALEINGKLNVFGTEVPFSLLFDPYVMENGNVQLRGKSVEVANSSLPVHLVMRLLGNQINFPDFIAFDSESQIIVLNLNELSMDLSFDLEMTQIDLINDVIEFNLQINEDVISEQF